MTLDGDPTVHLTYCTNVHPGESWADHLASLKSHLPAIRTAVAPGRPFGVGLRLSADAAETLSRDDEMEVFKDFLAAHDLYVFTVNGFPFGRFHGGRVKEAVYLPDWHDPARLAYSNRLAGILAELLPEGMEGSISTVPGAFRPRVAGPANLARIVDNLVRHAAHLADVAERSGKVIRLALEPEPCCYLETIEETVRFFEDEVFAPPAVKTMAELTRRSRRDSEDLLRRHLGVCFDVCHAAVEFEDEDALGRLYAAGIAVPKVQLSSALRLPAVGTDAPALLAPFDDGVYLHQVVESGPAGLRRFLDLDEALAALDSGGDGTAREWRVHFHVPVFVRDLGAFATTQDDLKRVLARQRVNPTVAHLEVETYTWGVLPEEYRGDGLAADIAREIEWVKRELAA